MQWREREIINPHESNISSGGCYVAGDLAGFDHLRGTVDIRLCHIDGDGYEFEMSPYGSRWVNKKLYVNDISIDGNVITGSDGEIFRINFKEFGIDNYNTDTFMVGRGNYISLYDARFVNLHKLPILSIADYYRVVNSGG
jgi:hypothetical protein